MLTSLGMTGGWKNFSFLAATMNAGAQHAPSQLSPQQSDFVPSFELSCASISMVSEQQDPFANGFMLIKATELFKMRNINTMTFKSLTLQN